MLAVPNTTIMAELHKMGRHHRHLECDGFQATHIHLFYSTREVDQLHIAPFPT